LIFVYSRFLGEGYERADVIRGGIFIGSTKKEHSAEGKGYIKGSSGVSFPSIHLSYWLGLVMTQKSTQLPVLLTVAHNFPLNPKFTSRVGQKVVQPPGNPPLKKDVFGEVKFDLLNSVSGVDCALISIENRKFKHNQVEQLG
jgi:hypothetical protein